jgi:large subunit ribosomal protein L31e
MPEEKKEKIKEEEEKGEQEVEESLPKAAEEELEEVTAEELPEEEKAKEAVKETPELAEEEIPTAEEEAKPERKEKAKKEKEEFVEERIYTVPLGKAWIMPPRRRAPRAMRMLKSFVTKHMKLEARTESEEEEEPKQLVITNEVNQKIWERGVEKPPRKVRVRAAKDKEGNITVFLAEGD